MSVKIASPSDAYREVIDQLVNETRTRSIASARIQENKPFPPQSDSAKYNTFIASLSSEQKSALVEMLLEERSSAIHDVLADLSWWIECEDVTLAFRGHPMPVGQSGMGLHGDYVGRCQGWEWPDQ